MARRLARRAWVLALALLPLTSTCRSPDETLEGEMPSGEPAAELVAAAEEPLDSAAGALRRFLPDEMRRSTRAETFPHEAHGEIDCAVCHQVPEGHGSHGAVSCADCHRASASTTVSVLSPADCQACHHSAEQIGDCSLCHETRGVERSVQQLAFEVWSAPRTRTLPFDHGRHAALECVSCHQAAPDLAAEACSACHESHHLATVRCQECHSAPPPGAHDVAAHLTCSGSGCHRAPDVEAISGTRAVCVVCHQSEEDHEPGGSCIECHPVRPGLASRLQP